jgi:hypothetical protein
VQAHANACGIIQGACHSLLPAPTGSLRWPLTSAGFHRLQCLLVINMPRSFGAQQASVCGRPIGLSLLA